MTQIDQIIADAIAGSPETHVAILAREVVRLREAPTVVVNRDCGSCGSYQDRGGGSTKCDGCGGDEMPNWNPSRALASARAIPADRVLGDGMVQVEQKTLERFKRIEVCARDFQERQRNLSASRDSYGFFQADNALEAALRANQGGMGGSSS